MDIQEDQLDMIVGILKEIQQDMAGMGIKKMVEKPMVAEIEIEGEPEIMEEAMENEDMAEEEGLFPKKKKPFME